jgi:RHS repeat-associated protein
VPNIRPVDRERLAHRVWLQGRPIAVVNGVDTGSPVIYHVHVDQLGRPVLMTGPGRGILWRATFRPFGEVHSITGSASLDARFPGQWFMLEAGLNWNWRRWYDPSLGRYTQPDPLGMPDGPSRYAYALNSPVMYTDREGMALGDLPPPPPGYDPSWPWGEFLKGRGGATPYLQSPSGDKYLLHPEDAGHWRHYDIQGPGGDDKGRWPPNCLKPRSNQVRGLGDNQSGADPSGDAAPIKPPFFLNPGFPQFLLPGLTGEFPSLRPMSIRPLIPMPVVP